MPHPPIVRYRGSRALVDRSTRARLSDRSVHTIRGACTVAHRDNSGRPLYDAEHCAGILDRIPTRQRR